MQLDKEQEQKWKQQQSVESKADCCAKQKANLQSACVDEGKAQVAGHFYEHGKAFDSASNNEIVDEDMDKNASTSNKQKSSYRFKCFERVQEF